MPVLKTQYNIYVLGKHAAKVRKGLSASPGSLRGLVKICRVKIVRPRSVHTATGEVRREGGRWSEFVVCMCTERERLVVSHETYTPTDIDRQRGRRDGVIIKTKIVRCISTYRPGPANPSRAKNGGSIVRVVIHTNEHT